MFIVFWVFTKGLYRQLNLLKNNMPKIWFFSLTIFFQKNVFFNTQIEIVFSKTNGALNIIAFLYCIGLEVNLVFFFFSLMYSVGHFINRKKIIQISLWLFTSQYLIFYSLLYFFVFFNPYNYRDSCRKIHKQAINCGRET